MIRLEQAVIVEGTYDKIKLENFIDGIIIPTNGFSLFKDREKCDLIRRVAMKRGIIIMTDSDSAGQLIRSYIKRICSDGNIINVYIPQIKGREHRKNKPSKEGYLGVEGLDEQTIINALRRSHVNEILHFTEKRRAITKTDLYLLGLSGSEGSALQRKSLCGYLELPVGMSSSAFLDAVNAVFGYEEFIERVRLWRQEADKS